MKYKSVKLNKSLNRVYNLSRKNKNETILFWIFLDADRIKDYKKFITAIPQSRNIAIIMRSKSKKNYYCYAKILLKLCKSKKFTFLIANNFKIAKAIGADGIHYSSKVNFARKDRNLITSCSYHGHNDYKRVKQLYSNLVFISPIYTTASNKNKKALGLIKISLLANYLKCQYSVLGGVSNKNISSLRNRGIKSVSGLDFICENIYYKC